MRVVFQKKDGLMEFGTVFSYVDCRGVLKFKAIAMILIVSSVVKCKQC